MSSSVTGVLCSDDSCGVTYVAPGGPLFTDQDYINAEVEGSGDPLDVINAEDPYSNVVSLDPNFQCSSEGWPIDHFRSVSSAGAFLSSSTSRGTRPDRWRVLFRAQEGDGKLANIRFTYMLRFCGVAAEAFSLKHHSDISRVAHRGVELRLPQSNSRAF